MALLFGLIRSMRVFHLQQQRREFVRRPTGDFHGKTVGILGLGGNGITIAKALRPMAGRIIGTDLFDETLREFRKAQPDSAIGCIDEIHPPWATDEVLARSEVIVVALPLTPDTSGYLDSDRLRKAKPGAWIVNVGRGQLVNHDALVESLQSGQLAGAALDVTEPEPLPVSSPLWEMDNVIISPHVGAQSSRRVPSTVNLVIANLGRWRQGQPLLNLVDKQLGFPRPEHRLAEEDIRSFVESAPI
ncbi:MAG: NAD(P)-dependent oxidoreductase, partial [Planctomycetota bacterium]